MANKWGINQDGTNQLLEHTIGKEHEPKRLVRLEEYAGLKPGSLSDVYSNDPNKLRNSMKNFNDLAEQVRTNPTDTAILEGGRKEVYWVRSVTDLNKGIGYIKYDGKPQSLMNMDFNDFNNKFKFKK